MKVCHACVHTPYALCSKHRDPKEVSQHFNRVMGAITEKMMKAAAEYLFQSNPILHMLKRK